MILFQLHLKDRSALNLQLYIACIWFLIKQHNYLLKKQTPESYLKTSLKEKKDMSWFCYYRGSEENSVSPTSFWTPDLQFCAFMLYNRATENSDGRLPHFQINLS